MAHSTDTLSQPIPMPRHTHLMRRRGRYYLNVKVPKDLRAVLKKELIRKSLKTSDHREAVSAVKFESFQIDSFFAEQRAKLRSVSNPLKPLPSLSKREAHEMVSRWFIQLEQNSDRWWEEEGRNLEPEERAEAVYNLEIDVTALGGGSRDYEEDDAGHYLDAYLKQQGFSFAKESETYRKLRPLFQRARLENRLRTLDRVNGQPLQLREPLFGILFSHTTPPTTPQTVTLGELLKQFLKAVRGANRSAGTLRTYEVPVRLLRETLGAERSLDSITRKQIEDLFELLQKAPVNATQRYPGLSLAQATAAAARRKDNRRLGAKTLANYFNNIVAIFNFAVGQRLMSENPARDKWMRAKFEGSDTRRKKTLFTVEELNCLFRAPLYTGCQNDESGYSEPGPNQLRRGRFWLPLLALFQGFRCNEAAQLYTEDVGEQDGILYIDIREDRENGSKCDKRLKTKQSNRRVPVHPIILEMGFPEFFEARRHDQAHPRLFQELPIGASGYFSDPFGKWFSRFVDKAVGEQCKATFHSLRHQFRNALDEAGVPIPDVELLGGWELMRSSSERDYRSGPRLTGARLRRMREHVGKIEYPGLDLKHLYRS